MKRIAITGASGFVARHTAALLRQREYEVVPISLRPQALSAGMPSLDLEGLDAVIHLAGEPIAGRWTPEKKRAILDSRVLGTRALVRAMQACHVPPLALISASASGYYGSRGDETLEESSAAGTGFLADVCNQWEREANAASSFARVAILRTGIVLGNGGALDRMRAPFRAGVGGPFGSGRQFVPWIHVDDLASMFVFAAENATISGPVNAVAPDYATSVRFAQALGSALGKPALLPAPRIALRLLLGEFADTLLTSQLMIPAVAEDAGFAWKHDKLEEALLSVAAKKPMQTSVRTYSHEQTVDAPLDSVFSFFADPKNLEAITPPSLQFAIVRAPERMSRGAQITYALSLHRIGMRWKTMIARWDPPHCFVDVQLHGPYTLWRHRHSFLPVATGVQIKDEVQYALPFAPFGNLSAPFVERDIRAIFEHRNSKISERFG